MSLITIRGQLGSGAPVIGRQVADKLRIHYVDRKIIADVAERLQRDESEVIRKEMPPGTLFGRVAEALTNSSVLEPSGGGAYLPAELIPLGDIRYLQALKSVVRELAKGPPLVIRGRGSQFILRDQPGSLHVFVIAPYEIRVGRVMRGRGIGEEAAREEIKRFDSSRHEFAKRYFRAHLEDPVNYDLVVNTGGLSFEATASLVADAFRIKADQMGIG